MIQIENDLMMAGSKGLYSTQLSLNEQRSNFLSFDRKMSIKKLGTGEMEELKQILNRQIEILRGGFLGIYKGEYGMYKGEYGRLGNRKYELGYRCIDCTPWIENGSFRLDSECLHLIEELDELEVNEVEKELEEKSKLNSFKFYFENDDIIAVPCLTPRETKLIFKKLGEKYPNSIIVSVAKDCYTGESKKKHNEHVIKELVEMCKKIKNTFDEFDLVPSDISNIIIEFIQAPKSYVLAMESSSYCIKVLDEVEFLQCGENYTLSWDDYLKITKEQREF
jgi:hypothetical protein